MKIKTEEDALRVFMILHPHVFEEFNKQKPINHEEIVMYRCIMQLLSLLSRRAKLIIAQEFEKTIRRKIC